MLFNSIEFFVFFFLFVAVYFAIPYRMRWFVILAGSCYFYATYGVTNVILLFISILITYVCARLMTASRPTHYKATVLLAGLVANLGFLFIFKYLNFIDKSLNVVFANLSIPVDVPVFDLLLPVGISFYTFRLVSYIIDVYRGTISPEKHFGIFASYVSFFPELLAGPIERAGKLIPQLRERSDFDIQRICSGIQLIFWGLFKKVVIADRLALYVDSVYDDVLQYSGLTYIVATYFFAIQIYCDFSGYSDMAFGCGRVLGFDLTENFRRPYFSASVTEFWHRWHISLSTWLRDYLYIPLGGSRNGKLRMWHSLFVTMLLGGLWHGANWTFVIWGCFHGVLLILCKATFKLRQQVVQYLRMPVWLAKGIGIFVTFHLICFLWVFFRANTVSDAVHIFTHMFTDWPTLWVSRVNIVYGLLGMFVLLVVQLLQTRGPLQPRISRLHIAARWALYYAVFFSIAVFGVDMGAQFIYFRF